ncbi:MAG TPA: hypothetical protein VMG58_06145 [Candidatus Sulfotelmatobacter sp.]|nr:hypothetical protein [Candidatus Sulfotelmatobacter sp.]
MCLGWEEHAFAVYHQVLGDSPPPHVLRLLQGHRAVIGDHIIALRAALGEKPASER